jgi:orotidine-5'-phosphate decarboxylase
MHGLRRKKSNHHKGAIMNENKPVFIALDFADAKTTWAFLAQFPAQQSLAVKVGMELFYREGPQFVAALKQRGYTVFLDLKLYDIPHTVGQATKNLARLGIDYLTLHAAGGEKMLAAAKSAIVMANQSTKLLAITQLTSFTPTELQTTQQLAVSLDESVVHLAQLAKQAGMAGVISSAFETPMIHQATSTEFLSITPGIRLQGDAKGDQSRIMTPQQARKNGANGIVVGRPITQAPNPVAAYTQITKAFNEE